jgi:hypothetical protein
MTTYAQYCRAERAAGGIGCTTRQFIRGCHTLLNGHAKLRSMRQVRHTWLRNMLVERDAARNLVR